ncbi:MAG: NAD(P)(+) transhydrogenase (Re/Si-specific) subunit beta [Nitrospira sp.]|nr:NAD(P)(+) transhydrogenase (Re/Si-specific) subunit beta [Nitrospira sp.]MCB9710316.1 NAD(P)(+) transhydrogenase (Re/Si-specific) subunit beta [Nitrospiraceae bacterium]MDR4488923.1 NAD(P)(+) transhydrogenase (Re/Si-specific) subunit beta [Nitrospirales bacterium]MCA9467046.1 NAD(P)(+) transhydrogenase (Re/Si-specific) subunit beta [Nitrospira sp.]MCA9474209.1 NAD(P)(+) transhydrogenase (Re/Si-specific) subunit beta [Nitrospira sp.]
MYDIIINFSYLIASVLFIFGLKGLTHPRTAVRGNFLGACGMFLAVVVTLTDKHIVSYEYIILGIIIGSAIGAALAIKIEMTSMPELVALLNGFGGAASIFVAGAALIEGGSLTNSPVLQLTIATAASGLIGAVTFWGSLVAFGKLQGIISENAVVFSGQQIINALLAVVVLGLSVGVVLHPEVFSLYWVLVGVASILGVLLVIPIGGADMPVVVALLNSYSGLAAAATGFVLSNNVLIITGSLVGASGIILTHIMCKAMNRSLTNVLFGVMAAGGDGGPTADEVYGGKVKSASPEEVALLFDAARRVVIVPGYGMAVSQAQHPVASLASLLESRGATVEYAIHPVAGRMPGHMNVLMAEADVPYESLKDMDEINQTFDQVDVALVIGANDVVNPLARTDPSSPIAGMPIIDVDKAKTVVIIKRSLSPGFAGIPNPLFSLDNSLMLFGDGKKMVLDIITALKES